MQKKKINFLRSTNFKLLSHLKGNCTSDRIFFKARNFCYGRPLWLLAPGDKTQLFTFQRGIQIAEYRLKPSIPVLSLTRIFWLAHYSLSGHERFQHAFQCPHSHIPATSLHGAAWRAPFLVLLSHPLLQHKFPPRTTSLHSREDRLPSAILQQHALLLRQQQFSHRAYLTVLPTLYLYSKYHARSSPASTIPILLKLQCSNGY